MKKTVFKEIIIGLLLCLAILLILAVLLYSYIPNNKVVPEPVSYKVPDDAKQVLAQSSSDTSQVILTYEVNSSDLNAAQRTNEYNPGKVDPFSTYVVKEAKPEEGTTEGGTSGNTSGTGNSSSTGGTTSNGTNTSSGNSSTTSNGGGQNSNSSNNGGTYFKDKGTK